MGKDCDAQELCQINDSKEAVCTQCAAGSWCSVDTCATCNDDDHCGAECQKCEHGCNAAGEECYEECNPVADKCCEPDGTTCKHGCASDGTCYPECNPEEHTCCDTDGTFLKDAWYDEGNALCWEKTPKEEEYNFYDAAAYCSSLGPGWRLPMIQELISLIDGCESQSCGVSFPDCLDSGCVEEPACAPCKRNANCFWNSDNLNGACPDNSIGYWSQSDILDKAGSIWSLNFLFASIHPVSTNSLNTLNVRCVRSRVGACHTVNENFDLGNGAFVHHPLDEGNDNDSWEYGTVSYLDDTVTCHTAEGCWATNRSGKYKWCESSALVSPMMDISGCGGLQLSFWQWYRYEKQVDGEWLDGAMVQISKNGGKDWEDVTPSVPYQGIFKGECDSPNYGITYVQTDLNVWSGTTAGETWQKVTIPIPGTHHTSMFRVRFVHGADQGPIDDSKEPYDRDLGWIVDDVVIGKAK